MAHDVTFIPGDGTGPELTEATRRVLEATGVDFNWDRHEAGIDEYRKHGNPFPDATLASLRRTGVGIKGPTTTPVGSGFRSINVLLRKELDLDVGGRGERLHDRQQRGGGERRRLVGEGVDDLHERADTLAALASRAWRTT